MADNGLYIIVDVKNNALYNYDMIDGLVFLKKLKTSFLKFPRIWGNRKRTKGSYITVHKVNCRDVVYAPSIKDPLTGNKPEFTVIHSGGWAMHLFSPTVNLVEQLSDNIVPIDATFLHNLYKRPVCLIEGNNHYYIDSNGVHNTDTAVWGNGQVAWHNIVKSGYSVTEKNPFSRS